MRDKDGYEDLERIMRKCEELVICEVPKSKCGLRGDYWKCYMGNFTKCKIYLNYIKGRR